MISILIIDDEKDVLTALRDFLESEHFEVFGALTAKQGLKVAEEKKPDMILLDLRLPDMDGYEVCKELRQNPKTSKIPIIMISTRSKNTEKVVGLEVGADDYLTKPYDEHELLARIRAVLRRHTLVARNEESPARFSHGTIEMNTEARTVTVNSRQIKLTRKEFDLLALFMQKPGKALSRASILSAVWGASYESLQGTVDSHIKTLRQKLGPAGKLIETLPGIGYKLSEF